MIVGVTVIRNSNIVRIGSWGLMSRNDILSSKVVVIYARVNVVPVAELWRLAVMFH